MKIFTPLLTPDFIVLDYGRYNFPNYTAKDSHIFRTKNNVFDNLVGVYLTSESLNGVGKLTIF